METAMTTMTTQLATEFVVPTIHLGSFKSYRLPGDRPTTTGNNDAHFSSNAYLQHQLQHGGNNNNNNNNNIPIRSASAPYPNMQSASSHKLYMAKHQPLGNSSPNANSTTAASPNPHSAKSGATSPPRMLPSPAVQVPAVSIQPLNTPPPPQTLGAPREVCLECMMRDEDMADVDVTSPGVWDRESDVWYHDLCRREDEEERERNLHPSTSSGISSSASCSRPRAQGTKLTEANLVAWLNLNPSEPTSKQHALLSYIDAQNAILAAENKARIQALQEARQLDEKMRESYQDLRRSPYDFVSPENSPTSGNKTRSPISTPSPLDDSSRHGIARRDTSQSSAVESRTRKSRKASRDSLSQVDPHRDAVHFYSLGGGPAGGGGDGSSARAQAVYGSTTSVPMPPTNASVIRNVQSMYMPNTSSNWQQQSLTPSARPASMSPDVAPGFASQTSLTSASPSSRKRFFGLRQWSGYFGSNASLAQSGSMMDMHLGLDQDKHCVHVSHVDIGSKPPSLKEGAPWPHVDARRSLDNATDASDGPKKKQRGLGKFWKMLSGGSAKSNEPAAQSHRHDLDEEPLAPPPPLSYLVNRGSMQSERSLNLPRNNTRHASMPSLSLSNTSHPTTAAVTTPPSSKTASARNQIAHIVGSPSDQSSVLPSPTDIRLSNGSPEVVVAVGDDERKLDMNSNPARVRSLSQNVISTNSHSMSTFPGLVRTFSVDKNLPPLPIDEEPDNSVVLTSVSTAVPSVRSILSSRATLPSQQLQQQYRPYMEEFPSSGARYEEPIRRQSFNGLITRPNLPIGAGRASIPGMRQYAYDEFGNPVISTGSRHSLAVGSVTAGVQTLPNGAKRKNKLGLGSFFGKKQ